MKPPSYFSRLGRISATGGGNLPHWSQACATFVTFRLGDSLPAGKMALFGAEREAWLAAHPEPWNENTVAEYRNLFPKRLQEWLDAGYGSCVLRQVVARQIVEECLRHFADIRYSLYAFVVMPNHVHVLFMPEDGIDGRKIVQNWKSYTSTAINRALKREGTVWQKESYDHLVRDVGGVTPFVLTSEEIVRMSRLMRINSFASGILADAVLSTRYCRRDSLSRQNKEDLPIL